MCLALVGLSLLLFIIWLFDRKEFECAIFTSYSSACCSLFFFILWTIIYFYCIYDHDEVQVYDGTNDNGEI